MTYIAENTARNAVVFAADEVTGLIDFAKAEESLAEFVKDPDEIAMIVDRALASLIEDGTVDDADDYYLKAIHDEYVADMEAIEAENAAYATQERWDAVDGYDFACC